MRIIKRCVKRLVPEVQPYLTAMLQTGYSAMAIRASLTSLRTQSLLASERARDPKRLLPCGFKGYSQNDEDGILQEIFRRINTTRRVFVEFGAGSGTENNTLYLLFSGWRGLWIECDAGLVSSIRRALAAYI
jgi:hypothetical protein